MNRRRQPDPFVFTQRDAIVLCLCVVIVALGLIAAAVGMLMLGKS